MRQTTECVDPDEQPVQATRKPPSEWKKSRRRLASKAMEPDFINKTELAHHLQCDISTIDEWIEDGTIPPPHSRPGERHPLWRRSHYKTYRETKRWPPEAYDDV